MPKLPSQQALEALRNPFRSLPNPLRGPLQTRYLRDELAPFSAPKLCDPRSGLPSFESKSNTLVERAANKTIERSEFANTHAIAGVEHNYDVLDTDTHNDTLYFEISKLVGIPYLKEATKDEANKVADQIHGVLYGPKLRMIFPCVLSIEDKARWVFFTVHSGSPLTYISKQVSVHPHRKNALT
jgi:hypothetical protein